MSELELNDQNKYSKIRNAENQDPELLAKKVHLSNYEL